MSIVIQNFYFLFFSFFNILMKGVIQKFTISNLKPQILHAHTHVGLNRDAASQQDTVAVVMLLTLPESHFSFSNVIPE